MEAENIQARIVENCPDTTARRFWPKFFWPPSSPDLNVMDFFMWGILTMKACEKPHANVKSLKLKYGLILMKKQFVISVLILTRY